MFFHFFALFFKLLEDTITLFNLRLVVQVDEGRFEHGFVETLKCRDTALGPARFTAYAGASYSVACHIRSSFKVRMQLVSAFLMGLRVGIL